jgi:FG-GAP-like repeat
MMKRILMSVLGVLLLAAVVVADEPAKNTTAPAPESAQQTTGSAAQVVPEGGMPTYVHPETPERRMARLGTVEDPGVDPDPNKVWDRFGRRMRIKKYERRLAAYDRGPGVVRPLAMVNFAFEIYQQNELYVWCWIPEPDEARRAAEETVRELTPRTRYNEATLDFFSRIRSQFSDLTPPPANKAVRFVESSEGLPNAGSWRNSATLADMNNDGFIDIIAPPERGGRATGYPSIFLGDGKGKWRFWEEVQWPRRYDYGGAAVADFNKDGVNDIALGVHLRGVSILLADGIGKFIDIREGLGYDYPTRRVAVADVDKDGWMDVVASSEGPTVLGVDSKAGRLRVYLNKKKGTAWEPVEVSDPSVKFGGDWVTVANLNGDKYPDIVASSVFFGSNTIVYLSEAAGKWKVYESDGDTVPSMGYYFASAGGPFTAKNRDDVVISYVRFWPKDLADDVIPKPPVPITTNIDRISFADGQYKRTPIMRWGGREGVWGMASGDFDGDGNYDVIYTRHNPREAGILLGDGKGGFTRAAIEGLPLLPNLNYDVQARDVNGDKRPDVIIMYETAGTTALSARDGAIQVFLNQGAGPVAPQTAKAATE